MLNLIQTATIFQTELDKSAVELATSGWMEINGQHIQYTGGAEVKIPKLDMDGLGDYNDGFAEGSVKFEYETKTMTMDRGRKFILPETSVDESGFVLTASSLMGEFQRTKVIPEIDAYRYSTIASGAITRNKASGGYTPTDKDILQKLYYDIAKVQDVIGENEPLVITISTMVAAILDMSASISKKLDVVDFAQGGVTLKVSALNGQHPLIRVGSSRMKTAYVFYDGKTASDGAESNPTPDQKKGGFAPAVGAKDINWIICPRSMPKAVSKTDAMRIFDPQTYQPSRSWAMDYRKFHDLWILDNAWGSAFVNVQQALS